MRAQRPGALAGAAAALGLRAGYVYWCLLRMASMRTFCGGDRYVYAREFGPGLMVYGCAVM
jgi:hypothetical protein